MIRLAERAQNRCLRSGFAALLLIAVLGVSWRISWSNVGQCLSGLILLYCGYQALVAFRRPSFGLERGFHDQRPLRFLLSVLALSLLARMLLTVASINMAFVRQRWPAF